MYSFLEDFHQIRYNFSPNNYKTPAFSILTNFFFTSTTSHSLFFSPFYLNISFFGSFPGFPSSPVQQTQQQNHPQISHRKPKSTQNHRSRNCRRCIQIDEAVVVRFCGCQPIYLPNIRFGSSTANALIRSSKYFLSSFYIQKPR